MTRVLIALEEPLLALGVRAALAAEADLDVLEPVTDAKDVQPAVDRLRPDVLLLDSRFQRATCPPLLVRLLEVHPTLRALVMVDHGDERCSVRALLNGAGRFRLDDAVVRRLNECCLVALRDMARGCIPRGTTPETIARAVRTVAAGELWLSPGLTAAGLASVARGMGAQPERSSLSPRELEIVGLVVEGMANKEIASTLSVSEQTIKNQLSRILQKLSLDNRVELALFAVRTHLA